MSTERGGLVTLGVDSDLKCQASDLFPSLSRTYYVPFYFVSFTRFGAVDDGPRTKQGRADGGTAWMGRAVGRPIGAQAMVIMAGFQGCRRENLKLSSTWDVGIRRE